MRHDPATILLYRPVNQQELDLIAASEWTAFPLQVVEQHTFYFGQEAASELFTATSSTAGYLIRFALDADYAAEFPTTSDDSGAAYFLVLAEEMVEFNYHIVGALEVVGLLSGA